MGHNDVQVFRDDEHKYLQWLQSHPRGYVLNTRRTQNPSYMVLHKASCTWIRDARQRSTPGEFTEGDYIKICADSVRPLAMWTGRNGRALGDPFSKRCKHCGA